MGGDLESRCVGRVYGVDGAVRGVSETYYPLANVTLYASASQPPGRGPVPGPGFNYTGSREILLESITNLNVILYLSTCHTVHIIVPILFIIMSLLIINTYVSLMNELKKKWKGTDE